MSRNALKQMYMSYLLPIVAYASVVWYVYFEQDSVTLQKIQNKAARLDTGLKWSVLLENMYKECGMAYLSHRKQHELSFKYKVKTGSVP